jgi:translocator protein
MTVLHSCFMRTRIRNIAGLVGFLALCLSVAAIGGAVTRTSVYDWYQQLAKPVFTPPDWVFSPVWIFLYLLMGISAWLVWRRADPDSRRSPLAAFGIQLSLNLIWSFVFFGARSIGWALIEIAFLWIAIAVTIRLFWRIDRLASGLLVPYIIWVTFAAILNASIYALN